MSITLPVHLGGHCNVTHTDPGALDYLIQRFAVTSMVDVGCGPGGQVALAAQRGLRALGVDGDFTVARPAGMPILIHDFTTGAPVVPEFDLGWSVEFVEHVEEAFVDNYFAVFLKCRVVFLTHATNLGGHHHVNCQPSSYWIEQFTRRGFLHDAGETHLVRAHSTMKREFVRNTGLLFYQA